VATAVFDVRDAAAMDAALAQLPEPFRGIDVLLNNAGLALGTAPAPQVNLDDWLTMIQTNVVGLVTITYKVLPTLIERKGAIINLSSVAGSYPYPGGNGTARPRRSSGSSRSTCAATCTAPESA
jgi:serine 3-dehydrogenase